MEQRRWATLNYRGTFLFFFVAFLSGICCVLSEYTAVLLFLLFFLLFLFFSQRKRILIFISFLFFLFGGIITFREIQFRQQSLALLQEDTAVLQGIITKKEEKNQHFVYVLTQAQVEQGNSNFTSVSEEQSVLASASGIYQDQIFFTNDVQVYLDEDVGTVGDWLQVSGEVAFFPDATNEGEFSLKKYYQSLKIDYCFYGSQVLAVESGGSIFTNFLEAQKARMEEVIQAYLPEEESGVLSAMLLGSKSGLDTEIKSLYQEVGVSHILAISGLHIGVLGYGLYRLLRRTPLSMGVAKGIALGFVLLYGKMVGFSPSSYRAIFLFVLAMSCFWLKKSLDPMTATLLAAFCLLVSNPFLAYHTGFQYSFVLTVFAILFSKKKRRKWNRFLFPLFLQIVCIPITAYYSFAIPLPAYFLNLCLIPLLPGVLLLGFLGSLRILPMVCFPVLHVFLSFYHHVFSFVAEKSWSSYVIGQPNGLLVLVFYTLLFCTFYCKRERRGVKRSCVRGLQVALGLLLVIFLFGKKIPSFVPVLGTTFGTSFEVDFLDVGQGDGIFVALGNGQCAFIDGGSTSESSLGKYVIMPFLKSKGYGKVEYWFITHLDADHYSGFLDCLDQGLYVEVVVLPKHIYRDEAYESFLQTMKRYGVKVAYVDAGDDLNFGDTEIHILFPDDTYVATERNGSSLVFVLTHKQWKFLFTGDISSEEEAYLVEQQLVTDVDVLKVCHHGSDYSNSTVFLQAIQSELAIISCAEKNSYGHPGADALARLEDAQSYWICTKDTGEITVKWRHGKLRVEVFCDE